MTNDDLTFTALRTANNMRRVGDKVRPRPEWRDDPNKIPSGRIVRIEPWGHDGALYVEGERRAFAAYVFERAGA